MHIMCDMVKFLKPPTCLAADGTAVVKPGANKLMNKGKCGESECEPQLSQLKISKHGIKDLGVQRR